MSVSTRHTDLADFVCDVSRCHINVSGLHSKRMTALLRKAVKQGNEKKEPTLLRFDPTTTLCNWTLLSREKISH
jgi:hypothetical protein